MKPLLGHSKIMTSLLYSHTSEDRKKQAVATLTSRILGHKSWSQDNGIQQTKAKKTKSK
jgi:hypothetical protein